MRSQSIPKRVGGHTPRPVAERFWPNVKRTDGCWLWQGFLIKGGYGQLSIGSRTDHSRTAVNAHRIAWELASGTPPPPGSQVGHTCDTPACVRNDDAGVYEVAGVVYPRFGHLFLTDGYGNMADMAAKGRSLSGDRNPSRVYPERLPRGDNNHVRQHPEITQGERNGRATMTDVLVLAIRTDRQQGMTLRELVAKYQQPKSRIERVIYGRSWRHLP